MDKVYPFATRDSEDSADVQNVSSVAQEQTVSVAH